MAHLQARLNDLAPRIAEICQISGTPGLSYGVIHEGEVFTDNYGYHDIDKQLPPTSQTKYFIGSLTKAFTAAAIAQLVDGGKIRWDDPMAKILGSGFHFADSQRTEELSASDVLSHQMGLQRSNQLWHGNNNEIFIPKAKTLEHVAYLKPVQPFRSTLHYNNWGYALMGEVIEKLTGSSYGTFIHDQILVPLGMIHTSCNRDKVDESIAKPYAALDDGSFHELSPPQFQSDTIMGSSQGIVSTVDDMLKWAEALLSGYSTHVDTGTNNTGPLKGIKKLFSKITPMTGFYAAQSHYGLGWVHAQLPAALGAVGCNGMFVKEMPIVGKGSKEVVLYHQGSLAGYTSAIYLIPGTHSAIVVLSNSISLNDCADWIGQLLLESLLGTTDTNDFVVYAKESAETQKAKFPGMRKSLESKRQLNTNPQPLELYAGTYYNEINDFFIVVAIDKDSGNLQLAFQGLPSQTWALEHYHHDSFLWLMSRDENVKAARFPYSPEQLYKIDFSSNADGQIDGLQWKHDADGPAETFRRSGI